MRRVWRSFVGWEDGLYTYEDVGLYLVNVFDLVFFGLIWLSYTSIYTIDKFLLFGSLRDSRPVWGAQAHVATVTGFLPLLPPNSVIHDEIGQFGSASQRRQTASIESGGIAQGSVHEAQRKSGAKIAMCLAVYEKHGSDDPYPAMSGVVD
ncbi:hypothetical protein G7K_0463-t1 [Saitoella complicata NRRL Y-17804]|uniref:Uncharacterized protein n=1 Tax=Saitoella complicata (strain BCRC 22490 / CBS 7301 / JCM 7358 / NBRC 10748 / NRRL Y-17804) TaxID=698492 RepID=A0A0E9N8U9_SAICN|nr:hypothetical protein G7K_0463-t1 [Saitoella complicata NRRL Y-17804]